MKEREASEKIPEYCRRGTAGMAQKSELSRILVNSYPYFIFGILITGLQMNFETQERIKLIDHRLSEMWRYL